MPKIEANRVYMVARWYPLDKFNSSRARFHTMGCWFSVELAREAAREANKELLNRPHREGCYTDHCYKFHVISYKIRDAKHRCIFNITKEN